MWCRQYLSPNILLCRKKTKILDFFFICRMWFFFSFLFSYLSYGDYYYYLLAIVGYSLYVSLCVLKCACTLSDLYFWELTEMVMNIFVTMQTWVVWGNYVLVYIVILSSASTSVSSWCIFFQVENILNVLNFNSLHYFTQFCMDDIFL